MVNRRVLSESTGNRVRACGKRHDEVATHDERPLLASARVRPAFERVVEARMPASPESALSTTSTSSSCEGRDGSCAKANAQVVAELRERRRITHAFIAKAPDACSQTRVRRPRPRPHTSACRWGDDLDPGVGACARHRALCVPMEPVAPRTTRRRGIHVLPFLTVRFR